MVNRPWRALSGPLLGREKNVSEQSRNHQRTSAMRKAIRCVSVWRLTPRIASRALPNKIAETRRIRTESAETSETGTFAKKRMGRSAKIAPPRMKTIFQPLVEERCADELGVSIKVFALTGLDRGVSI